MGKLVELFCDVDDFCKVFIPQWRKQLLEDGTQKRQREGQMTTSEISLGGRTAIRDFVSSLGHFDVISNELSINT